MFLQCSPLLECLHVSFLAQSLFSLSGFSAAARCERSVSSADNKVVTWRHHVAIHTPNISHTHSREFLCGIHGVCYICTWKLKRCLVFCVTF